MNEAGVGEEDARVWVESGQVAGRPARTREAEPLVEWRVARLALKREARHAELARQLDQRAHHTAVSKAKASSQSTNTSRVHTSNTIKAHQFTTRHAYETKKPQQKKQYEDAPEAEVLPAVRVVHDDVLDATALHTHTHTRRRH